MLQPLQDQRATTSDHMFNIVQNNNLLYKILQPLQDHKGTTSDHMLNIKQNNNPLY